MVDREVQERLELEAKELRMKREAEWVSKCFLSPLSLSPSLSTCYNTKIYNRHNVSNTVLNIIFLR